MGVSLRLRQEHLHWPGQLFVWRRWAGARHHVVVTDCSLEIRTHVVHVRAKRHARVSRVHPRLDPAEREAAEGVGVDPRLAGNEDLRRPRPTFLRIRETNPGGAVELLALVLDPSPVADSHSFSHDLNTT